MSVCTSAQRSSCNKSRKVFEKLQRCPAGRTQALPSWLEGALKPHEDTDPAPRSSVTQCWEWRGMHWKEVGAEARKEVFTVHADDCNTWERPRLQFRRHKSSGSIARLGRSPGGGHGNSLQCSCLGNPMDRGAWRAIVQGLTNSQTQLSN